MVLRATPAFSGTFPQPVKQKILSHLHTSTVWSSYSPAFQQRTSDWHSWIHVRPARDRKKRFHESLPPVCLCRARRGILRHSVCPAAAERLSQRGLHQGQTRKQHRIPEVDC